MADFTLLSADGLEALITRCEGSIFMGTSTHQDIVVLIDAEAEVQRREQASFRRALHTERQFKASQTGSGDSGTLTL